MAAKASTARKTSEEADDSAKKPKTRSKAASGKSAASKSSPGKSSTGKSSSAKRSPASKSGGAKAQEGKAGANSGGRAKGGSKSAAKRSASSRSRKEKTPTVSGARPVWSGNLRLALVSVPVRVYAATHSGARISFHQVHEPSGKRVRYEKVVPGLGPIDMDDIVKGYEVERGRYVLIEPEELDELKLEARKTIDMVQFVQQGEIDPIWFSRPYYVVPDGDLAEEAYGVLRDALRRTKRLGLGQFVMRGREYVAAIKPCGSGLLLETLRFADEVSSAAPFFAGVDEETPDQELLQLAEELIEKKSAPFDPKRFEDEYTEAVRRLIDAKSKRGKPVEVDEEREEPSGGGKVVDLVEALKRSVNSAERGGRGGSGPGGASSGGASSGGASPGGASSGGRQRKSG